MSLTLARIQRAAALLAVIGVALIVPVARVAEAATGSPKIINYQARLLDTNGNLLGGSGTEYCFTFSFYDTTTSGTGTKLWPLSEVISTSTVTVRNGVFNVGIGDTSVGGNTLDFDFNSTDTVYLNVQVAAKVGATCAPGDGAETYETFGTRPRINSSGYALNANTLSGFSASQTPTGNQIPVLQSGNLVLSGDFQATNATTTNATTTNLAVTGSASTSNLTISNGFTFGNFTGILKAVAGSVVAALVDLANDVTGVLGVGNGGTGWAYVASGAVLFGNGSGSLATTTAGTPGYVLSYLNGVPTWTATSTYAFPLVNTGNTVSLGFGTTTANTWGTTQTFSDITVGTASIGTLTATSSAMLASTTAQGRFITGNIVATSSATSTFAGPVAIGTTSTSYLVSVFGTTTGVTSATGTAIMAITNTSASFSSSNNVLRLNVGTPHSVACTSGTTCPRFIEYFAGVPSGRDTGGRGVGSLRLSTAGTGITQTSGAADFAEFMVLSEAASAGDIVSLNSSGQYQRAVSGQSLIGVVSNNAAFVGNANLEGQSNAYIVGFAGVIETTVSTVNGAINAGDLITVGNTAGVGVKLVSSGYAVGQALESYSSGGNGTIDVLVFPKYVDAAVALQEYGGSQGGVSGYFSLATSTKVVSLASSTYSLFAPAATFTAATTTYFAVTGSATSTFGSGINLATGCFSIGGSCLNLSGVFSTSTNDWWLGTYQKGFFFSTTSADNWQANRNFFSTTSADAWDATKWRWSTSSSDFAVNAFVAGSTTIPKTFAANAFTALQQFSAGATTSSLTINGTAFIGTASTTDLTTTNLTITGAATTTAQNGFNIATGCFSVNGVCLSGDAADGTFSTTSADYWRSVRNFFSTTSADYYESTFSRWATTSSDWWLSTYQKGYFFSTTSADVWESQQWRWSTSSTQNFLAQNQGLAFSTTSADAWKAERNFFSTTSANYFESTFSRWATSSAQYFESTQFRWASTSAAYFLSQNQGLAFSTTSADAWKNERNFFSTTSADNWQANRNFFSTTSANAWDATVWRWSTTSSDYWLTLNQGLAFSTSSSNFSVNAFINGSTTIAKTFTANAFTALQTFQQGASTSALTISNVQNALVRTDAQGNVSGIATSSLGINTNDLVEGNSNLFYTDGRVSSYLGTVDKGFFFSTTSADWWFSLQNISAFSTTSADWWKDQRNFFSTTSVNAWEATQWRWATTSSDYWMTVRNFFSTTSADAWDATKWRWSTSSSDFAVNAFVAGSTTIPKTFAANAFTALQQFSAGASSTNLSVSGIAYIETASTTNLSVVGQGTSTFAGGVNVKALNVTGVGTSTSLNGFNIATGCFAVAGVCITSGSAADGTFSTTSADWWISLYDKGFFFSTTSANAWEATQWRWATTSQNYWETTQWRWSTTSSDYWLSINRGNAFSTTSADAWQSQRNFFSTTSANAWDATKWRWSTSSSDFAVNAFIHGSSTIAKLFVANAWTALQTFSAGASTTNISVSGTLYAETASTTNLAVVGQGTSTFAGGIRAKALDVFGTATSTFGSGINLATGCFSINGVCIGQGEPADGSFSTTSADYWQTQRNFFSTTSANAWEATKWRWATTSSDWWLSQYSKGYFFSTTSANAWDATVWRWSTSSSDFAVNAFINGSTTIPKTFASNSWSLLQLFAGGASTTNLSVFNTLFIGGSATTTIQGNVAGTSTIQGFINVAGTNSTSTFSGKVYVNGQLQTGSDLAAARLNISGAATSTFAQGINLSEGCFAINGTCVGGGTGESGGGPGSGVLLAIQVFSTPGAATYNKSSGATTAQVVVTGAGGGGGGADNFDGTTTESAGGGGGAGGTTIEVLDLTGIVSVPVTVGTGGSGGSVAGGNGNPGGDSYFGTYTGAGGGSGGVGAPQSASTAACADANSLGDGGSGGAASSTGSLYMPGGDGTTVQFCLNNLVHGGNGGASYWGGQVEGGVREATGGCTAGNAGVAYGTGGGGAACVEQINGALGGDGAGGVVVVYEYGPFTGSASTTALSALDYVAVGRTATTTIRGDNATSTFSWGIETLSLNITGSATSTFGNGINLATGCFSIAGACIGLGGVADGNFSTTSADYWQTQRNFFSTTSANAWEATQWRWATTSSDWWLSQYTKGYFFSTTSADTWDSTKWRWSTSSSDFAVGQYISGSSTIPHVGGSAYGDILSWTGSAWATRATSTLGVDLGDTTGVLGIAKGGTGQTTYTKGDILYSDANGSLAVLPIGASGEVLKVQSGVPFWGIDLTTGGGGGGGLFSTTTDNLVVYNTYLSKPVVIGDNATSSENQSVFEVIGKSYFSEYLGIGTTSAGSLFSVGSVANFAAAGTTFYTGLNLIGAATTTAANGFDITGGCFSINGMCIGQAAGADGAFSTTSADWWQANRNFFSTTSADAWDAAKFRWATSSSDYWLSINRGNAFSTTSADAWQSQRNFFSTTSANAWDATKWRWSTSSSDFAVNAFIHGSSTIAKLFAANAWTSLQAFNAGASSTNLSVSGTLFAETASTTNLRVVGVATSSFAGGLDVKALNITGTATSTSANGINLASGCFSIKGACIGGGGASAAGTANGQIQYYASGNLGADAKFVWDPNTSRLGVGTSTPYAKLSISANANEPISEYLFLISSSTATATTTLFSVARNGLTSIGDPTGTGDAVMQFAADANAWTIGYASSTKKFQIASSTALGGSNVYFEIGKNGMIAIGTSTYSTSSQNLKLIVGTNAASGPVAQFGNSTGVCTINPNSASLLCSSDARLKKNVEHIASSTSPLGAILALNPVYYNWNTDSDSAEKHAGFIAQQVDEVLPDLIEPDMFGFYTLNYAGLTPYLTGAIQELDSRYLALASSTAASSSVSLLEGRVRHLEDELAALASSTQSSSSSADASVPSPSSESSGTSTALQIGSLQNALVAVGGEGSMLAALIGPSLVFADNTLALDLTHANTWTGLQTFSGEILTASLVAQEQVSVGSASTTDIRADGATSTFSGGINVTGGCVSVNGTCIGEREPNVKTFAVEDDTVAVGEVLSFGASSTLARSRLGDARAVAGVVVASSSVVSTDGLVRRDVKLAGPALMRVNAENGPIVSGDGIALSSTPGAGKRAGTLDDVIGVALGDWNASSTDMLMVFLQARSPSSDKLAYQLLGSNSAFFGDVGASSESSSMSRPLDFIGAMMNAIASRLGSLTTSDASTSAATSSGIALLNVLRGITDHTATSSQLSALSIALVQGTTTPEQKESVRMRLNDSGNLVLERVGEADLTVSFDAANEQNALLVTIDSQGNASFAGTLAAAGLVVGTSQKPSGITLYDEETGDAYCSKVVGGVLRTFVGACGNESGVSQTASAAASSDPFSLSAAPIIKINGNNPAYIDIGTVYNDLGALVTDDHDQNLGMRTYIDGVYVDQVEIDTSTSTVYTIRYEATDSDGNIGSARRIVVVGDGGTGIGGISEEPPAEEVSTETTANEATSEPAADTATEAPLTDTGTSTAASETTGLAPESSPEQVPAPETEAGVPVEGESAPTEVTVADPGTALQTVQSDVSAPDGSADITN